MTPCGLHGVEFGDLKRGPFEPDLLMRADGCCGTYQMTSDQRVEWDADVRSLYDGMVRIVVTPAWAKLIDFETTLPSAVEELIRQRDERQRA